MKTFIGAMLTTILVTCGANAQTQTAKGRYEFVSKQLVLPVAVVQNDCPLVVEQFFVVRDDKGKYQTEYKVRNTSSRAIRAYRIARWYSDNTGFMGYGAMPVAGRVLRPKMSVDTFTSKRILAAGSGEKLEGSLLRIVFFMVVGVEFEDGSAFDASPVFESFTKHLVRFEPTYDAPAR